MVGLVVSQLGYQWLLNRINRSLSAQHDRYVAESRKSIDDFQERTEQRFRDLRKTLGLPPQEFQ